MTIEDDYYSDVRSSPEKYGLEVVAEVDTAGSYEFDMCCVWRHKETGKLYFATDSGCSCPAPFEDYKSLDSLREVGLDLVEEWCSNQLKSEFTDHTGDIMPFLEKVRAAYRAREGKP